MIDKELALEVAVARCTLEGMVQSEIAELLRISQSSVNKIKNNNNHIRPPELNIVSPDGVSKRELYEYTDLLLGRHNVRNYLCSISPYDNFHVDIIFGKEVYKHDEQEGFDPRATKIISKLINRSRVVGLAWDLGLKPYAEDISGFVSRDRNKCEAPIRFIPLCGITSRSQRSLVMSSTVIAMDYNRLVNRNFGRDAPNLLNLNCIPLVHPSHKFESKVKVKHPGFPDSKDVVEYLRAAFPDYETIFGSMTEEVVQSPPLINQCDMIFTGNGVNGKEGERLLNILHPNTGTVIPGVKRNRKSLRKEEFLKECVVGDVAGVLLPNMECEEAEENIRITKLMNNRLATLRPEHLIECCQRSADSDANEEDQPPGVVLIAHGALRARAVVTAIKLGLVSRVIVDYRLSKEIENISDI